jgi:hypothetical protein
MMRRRELLALFGGTIVAAPHCVLAQAQKVPTIGVLVPNQQMERAIRLFRQGLRDISYASAACSRLA